MDFTKIAKSPIILTEENRRFAMDSTKETHGYVKLETDGDKGLVVVSANNIRPFPDGRYIYKLIFAGIKKEKRHYHIAGSLSVSPDGAAQGSFRIDPRNLNGHGMAFRDFSTVIIAAMSTINCREALHPVMKGAIEDSVSKVRQKPAVPKDYSPFYNSFVLDKCRRLENTGEKYIDVMPFDQDLTDASWKKITDSNLFPMVSPGSAPHISKYGHFLYGCGSSHYYLGVPGRFFPQEQPDEGESGFVFWQPIAGMDKEAGDKTLSIEERRKNIYGYWIAAINRYNGHIEEIPLIDR